MSQQHDRLLTAPSVDYTGQDTLVISNTSISRRSSVITSILSERDRSATISRQEVMTDLVDEERFFRQALERELDEHKYRINRKMTSGGMGAVYYVFDRDFLRYSAMKVILPELKHSSSIASNFIREARITAQLEHPNIIPVHDMGFLPGHGIFFTMKMMEGERLVDVLRQLEIGNPDYLRKYDFFRLLGIFRKVCDAVAFAHSKNVLHRDIKPHNVMVGEYGEVLLMDWGLATRKEQIDDELEDPHDHSTFGDGASTDFGVVKGSPAYMSPEQAAGDSRLLDERSDIFLLGATLYQIFTFFPPYLGDDIYEILDNARAGNVAPPHDVGTGRLGMPAELCHIIGKAMAKNKSERYQNVAELADDMDALLRGEMHFGERTFAAGETLMYEGEMGAESYIIISGRVRVEKSRGGRTVEICTLSTGDIVGEMALITHEPRSATVIAVEKTEVLVLTQELFTRNLKRLPPWMDKTIVTLAERLDMANSKLSGAMPTRQKKAFGVAQ